MYDIWRKPFNEIIMYMYIVSEPGRGYMYLFRGGCCFFFLFLDPKLPYMYLSVKLLYENYAPFTISRLNCAYIFSCLTYKIADTLYAVDNLLFFKKKNISSQVSCICYDAIGS